MVSPQLLSGAAVLLAGAALLGLILRSDPGAGLPPPGASQEALRAELDQLQEQQWLLRQRLATRADRSEPPAPPPPALTGFVTEEQLEALREEIRLALGFPSSTEGGRGLDPDPESFEAQVAEALASLRKQESVRGFRAKQQGQAARIAAAMPKIEQWLELSPAQTSEMQAVLELQLQRDAQVLAAWEAGEAGETLGQVKRQNLETHRLELAAILSPTQLETWWTRVHGQGK